LGKCTIYAIKFIIINYYAKQNYKKIIKILLILVILILVGLVGFYTYTKFFSYQEEQEYLDKVINNPNIQLEEKREHFILTNKKTKDYKENIIFYPGGLVNPKAYLYKLSNLVGERNIRIFLIKAPFKASIFDINAGRRIIDKYNLENVIIGGHSLGGISACRLIDNNSDKIIKLFLLGSYCDTDISDFKGEILSNIGQNDQIINKDNYNNSKINLPENTIFTEKEGLNHSGFGNYGLQKGDGELELQETDIINLIQETLD